MRKSNKPNYQLLVLVGILAVALLTACNGSTPVNACHATGDPANPYEEITIDSAATAEKHLGHPDDLYPVPEGGCPTSPVEVIDDQITICHATSSNKNPYDEITVSVNGLNGHGEHEEDIIPAPVGGCPTTELEIVEDQISICHATEDKKNPYEEITVHVNGLDGHVEHEGDIVPAPVGGCPTSPLEIVDGKIEICHATSRKANPYNQITVSVNGLNGHDKHEEDMIPMPVNGCPTTLLDPVEGKITICHATGNESDPFNEITVSMNGLNGHDKHEGDIIPAPAAGCPTNPVVVDAGKITICHATSSKKNAYNEITVSVNGLNGHDKHENDIIPAPGDGCPSSKIKNK